MNNEMEFIVASLTLGTGATLVMDLWAGLLKRVFGIPSLNYAMVGRWIGHFPRGRFRHENIGQAAQVRFEKPIGWGALRHRDSFRRLAAGSGRAKLAASPYAVTGAGVWRGQRLRPVFTDAARYGCRYRSQQNT